MKLRFLLLIILAISCFLTTVSSTTSVLGAPTETVTNLATGIDSFSYWYSEYMKGVKIGFRNETRTSGFLNNLPVIITTSYCEISLNRLGSVMNVTTKTDYYETPDGKPLKLTQISTGAKTHDTTVEAVFNGNTIEVTTKSYGNESSSTLVTDGNILFPYAIDKTYQQNPRKSFNYKTLIPDMGIKIVTMNVDYIGTESTDLKNEQQEFNKYKVTNDALQSLVDYEWRDDNGIIFKATSSLMDSASFFTGEDEAKTINESNKVDVIAENIILTKKAIPNPRELTQILYIAKLKQGNLAGIFVIDNRQKIQKQTIDEIYLNVESYLPDFLAHSFPFTDPTFKPYLKDNNYIQPSYPIIATTAKKIVGTQKNAFLAAKALEKWVSENIKEKNYDVGMATASEIMETFKGDCTEHAILLASLCRAVGIPAQIVVGLVYMPIPGSDKGSFAYHMWTEVYVGEWIDLDASMANNTVVDATHLALLKSTLNNPDDSVNLSTTAMNVMGNLELDILNYSSRASGLYDISNQASMNVTNFDLSKYSSGTSSDNYVPFQNINLETLKGNTDRITKFNITGIPNTSPILESYEGYFTKGMAVYAKGDIDKSIDYFEKASSLINKDDAQKYYDLGVRLSGIMMFSLAKQQLTTAIDLNDSLWSSQAKSFLDKNYPRGTFNSNAEKYNMTGFSFANFASNYPAATLMYEKAIDASPGFERAIYNLANVYALQGDYVKALEYYNTASRIDPTNPLTYSSIANAYYQNGNIDASIANYEKAIKLGGGDSKFINENRFKSATLKAEKLLKKNQKDYSAYLLVGQAALDNESYEEARKAFIKVLSINDKIATGHTGLGKAYLKLGQPLKAENEFNKALRLNSGEKDAYWGLGIINKRRLNYPSAISYLNRAIALNPGNTQYHIDLGDTYIEMNNYNKAIATFSKIKNALGAYKLGETYYLSNQTGKATSYFQLAIQKNPYDARPYKDLGKIYLENNDLNQARKYIENAIALDTNYSDAYYILGLINEQESNTTEAANNFVTAYSISPTSIEAYKKAYQIFEEAGELNKFNLPRPKYVPARADKEYLIKLLYLVSLQMQTDMQFYDVVLNNCKNGLFLINTDLMSKQVLKMAVTMILNKSKTIYKQAYNTLKPPSPFYSMNNAFLGYLWGEADYWYKVLYTIDAGLPNNKQKALELSNNLNQMMGDLVNKKVGFYTSIQDLFTQSDPISFDEVSSSAGFELKAIKLLDEKIAALNARTLESIQSLESEPQGATNPAQPAPPPPEASVPPSQ